MTPGQKDASCKDANEAYTSKPSYQKDVKAGDKSGKLKTYKSYNRPVKRDPNKKGGAPTRGGGVSWSEEKLGKISRTSGGPKKFMVKVKDKSTGNVKTVRFGDPTLSINRDSPTRRKSFRARHNCETPARRYLSLIHI